MVETDDRIFLNAIKSNEALRMLHHSVKANIDKPDPAPWRHISEEEIEFWAEDNRDAYVRQKKLEALTVSIFLRSLLKGHLVAQYPDDGLLHGLPAWLWEEADTENSLFYASLHINPLLPDQWWKYSAARVYLNQAAFEAWIHSIDWETIKLSPDMPDANDVSNKPLLISSRELPTNGYASLSEALSWIGFSIALDHERFRLALDYASFGSQTEAQLKGAVIKLTQSGLSEKVRFLGKYVEKYNDQKQSASALTAKVDPMKFLDFAQFDSLYGGLRHGNGLSWERENNSIERALNGRQDGYRDVLVNREDLVREFPGSSGIGSTALQLPRPVSLAGVGDVVGLDDALSWIAHGRPSHDTLVWWKSDGDLHFTEDDGSAQKFNKAAGMPESLIRYREAQARLLPALRSGEIVTYFERSEDGKPRTISRYYWNQTSEDFVDPIYQATESSSEGAGCLIFVSKTRLDEWRHSNVDAATAGGKNRHIAEQTTSPPLSATSLDT